MGFSLLLEEEMGRDLGDCGVIDCDALFADTDDRALTMAALSIVDLHEREDFGDLGDFCDPFDLDDISGSFVSEYICFRGVIDLGLGVLVSNGRLMSLSLSINIEVESTEILLCLPIGGSLVTLLRCDREESLLQNEF